MPTKKQLHFVWESQFKLFGGSGQPKQHYEGISADNGLTSQKNIDVPLVRRSYLRKSKGKKIGEIVWDGSDLHIVPNKSE